MAILPDLSAASFERGAEIDNPYFPLTVGRVMSYRGTDTDPDTGEITTERNDLFTTAASHEVRGVETRVVRDTVYEDDLIIEDTFDWYAQDTDGNVWYFGEIVVNYEYDDEGTFVGTNDDGAWSADDPGNAPGWHTKAEPAFGPAYYLEYAPGVAEDESIITATGLTVTTPFATYEDVVQIVDSAALSSGIEYKFYARGVGEITEEAIDAEGNVTTVVDLFRDASVGAADRDDTDDRTVALADLREGRAVRNLAEVRDLDAADVTGGGRRHVAVVGGRTDSADALGAYLVDAKTGEIGEARILVADLSEAQGQSVAVDVPEGMTLGLFLVRGADEIGVDLGAYADGGLRVGNLLAGEPASLADLYPVTVTDEGGNILPIQPLHALGGENGGNLLNPAGSLQAIGLSSRLPGARQASLIGFEDRMNTSPEHDGDFNDAVVAVSGARLSEATLRMLGMEARGAKLGTSRADRLEGGDGDDRLHGLSGHDRLLGRGGDDRLAGGGGDDWLRGGAGADVFRIGRWPGIDRIADLDTGAGDVIALAGSRDGFAALDTDGNGRLGTGDAGVSVSGEALTLDLGAGTGIQILGITTLDADAFAFI